MHHQNEYSNDIKYNVKGTINELLLVRKTGLTQLKWCNYLIIDFFTDDSNFVKQKNLKIFLSTFVAGSLYLGS